MLRLFSWQLREHFFAAYSSAVFKNCYQTELLIYKLKTISYKLIWLTKRNLVCIDRVFIFQNTNNIPTGFSLNNCTSIVWGVLWIITHYTNSTTKNWSEGRKLNLCSSYNYDFCIIKIKSLMLYSLRPYL
jgi:hypothetical protein